MYLLPTTHVVRERVMCLQLYAILFRGVGVGCLLSGGGGEEGTSCARPVWGMGVGYILPRRGKGTSCPGPI